MLQLLGSAYLALFTVPLVAIDIRQRRLPNKITLPGIAITLLGILLAASWGKAIWALGCALLVFSVGTLLSMRGWIGMGDVKLLVPIALTLGWYGPDKLVFGLTAAFVIAGVVVLIRWLLKKITASSTIALGPFLLGGFWLALIPQVWS